MVAVLHPAPSAGVPEAVASWLASLRGIYPPNEQTLERYRKERGG